MYVIPMGSLRGARCKEFMEFSNGSACEIAAVAYCFPSAPPLLGARGPVAVNQHNIKMLYSMRIRITLDVYIFFIQRTNDRKSTSRYISNVLATIIIILSEFTAERRNKHMHYNIIGRDMA